MYILQDVPRKEKYLQEHMKSFWIAYHYNTLS